MTTHLASHFLSPNGYVVFCGDKDSFYTDNMGDFLTNISKKTVM